MHNQSSFETFGNRSRCQSHLLRNSVADFTLFRIVVRRQLKTTTGLDDSPKLLPKSDLEFNLLLLGNVSLVRLCSLIWF